MRYDEVIQRLVDACEQEPSFARVQAALVVRTVDGRVRLALDGGDEALLSALDEALLTTLGSWFSGPVISRSCGPQGLRRVAAELLQRPESWPDSWPTAARGPNGLDLPVRAPRWRGRQVVRGKGVFLTPERSVPPWPLHDRTPRITAFYGFKGGVGRTTTLGVTAWHLAQRGERVVVVDLDLESPGLGHALEADHRPTDGLIDYLLTTAVEGRAELPLQEITLHGAPIQLVPAGALDPLYVEKLARLDLLHHDSEGRGPVHAALVDLVQRLRSDGADHILLDCRSGLHDLAGLALHDLAHVDVFVGRGDRQELDGMRPLLRGWRARRPLSERRLLFLRTMRDLPLVDQRTTSQKAALYEVLCEELYGDAPPSEADQGTAHDPCPIGFQPEIANARWLGEVDPATLSHATFADLLNRLDALWTPEP